MMGLVQRVDSCVVRVDGGIVSSIGPGLLILLGVHREDTDWDLDMLARKCTGLRVFQDDEGKMNRSVADIGGSFLVVSQFTLFGDVRRGLRPFFGDAALPDKANDYYERFMAELTKSGLPVKGGVFGAHMHLEIHNDGPVTIPIDTRNMR